MNVVDKVRNIDEFEFEDVVDKVLHRFYRC